MFGRLTDARLKAAEAAVAGGLLDEAFAMAASPDLGDGRRQRKLLSQLAEALMRRGQDHLLGKRFDDAMTDFDRAARCGHPAEKVIEWQDRAKDAKRHHQATARRQDAAIAEARNHLAAGSIAGANQARETAPMENSEIAALSQAIHSQAERAKASLDAARSALRENDLPRAVQQYRIARTLHAKLDGLGEMETVLYERVIREVTQDYRGGKLTRAHQQMRMLEDVGRGRNERVELEEALRLADAAAKALAGDHYTQAGVLLGRLMQVGLEAGWVQEVRERLKILEESRRSLLEGPLGLLCDAGARDRLAIARGVEAETRSIPRDVRARSGASPSPRSGVSPSPRNGVAPSPVVPLPVDSGLLPRRILLQIDGVGSFLVLRGDRIGVGRAGSKRAELELLSDLSERHAEIIRAGEDYFVVCSQGVELTGRRVDHALLQDGDRVRLGHRVRLTFRRPSLKSITAVLDLGEGVRAAAGDCRRVILWDGPILMGSTRESHIPLPSHLGGFILLDRAGQLFARTMGPAGEAYHLPLGVQTTIGGLRLSANGFSGGSGVGRVIG